AAHAVDFRRQRPIVVDVGGGSVEIIAGQGDQIRWIESLKLGVVRLTERFLRSDPPGPREIATLQSHLDRTLAPVFRRARRFRPSLLVGTSGTLLNLTAMAAALEAGHAPARIHNRTLTLRRLAALPQKVFPYHTHQRSHLL